MRFSSQHGSRVRLFLFVIFASYFGLSINFISSYSIFTTHVRKSLQVIALIHTLLTHPLLGPKNQRKVKRVMLIAPVNTLANWENEFSIWIDQNSIPNFRVYDLSNVASSGRSYVVENWYNHGGVLFGSPQIIERMVLSGDYSKFLQEPGPDRKYQLLFL
jgi:hypothetical protein